MKIIIEVDLLKFKNKDIDEYDEDFKKKLGGSMNKLIENLKFFFDTVKIKSLITYEIKKEKEEND